MDKELDLVVDCVFCYIVGGDSDVGADSLFSIKLTTRFIDQVASEIVSRLGGLNFEDDPIYDFITSAKDLNYVKDHFFGSYDSLKILKEHASQPWMVAQLCSLAALKNKKFEFYSTSLNDMFESNYSWPCLYEGDNRLVIPVVGRRTNEKLFVMCDEYWGLPSSVISFGRKKVFNTGSSPLMRAGNYAESLLRVIKNLVAWLVLGSQAQADSANKYKSYLFVGGVPNPSHVIWNYLGGVNFAQRSGFQKYIGCVVQTSDLLFRTDHLSMEIFDIRNFSKLDQIRQMCLVGLGKSIGVRLSDAGVGGKNCLALYDASLKLVTNNLSALDANCFGLERQSSLKSLSIRIGITIRSGRRKIHNQVMFWVDFIQKLSLLYGHIDVVFDGCSEGGIGFIDAENELANSIVAIFKSLSNDSKLNVAFETAIGLPIERQIVIYSKLDSFLTYVSGGNAKFIGFFEGIGVVFGPQSATISKASFGFDEAIKATAILPSISRAIFDAQDMFLVTHDYSGMSSNMEPPMVISGASFEGGAHGKRALDFDVKFDEDFVISQDLLSDCLAKTIRYNRIKRHAFKGVPL